jgi:hypothetical protein
MPAKAPVREDRWLSSVPISIAEEIIARKTKIAG